MMDEHTARPLADWHEDIGPVLWWTMPVTEAPYVGSPLDLGKTVEIHTHDTGAGPRVAARTTIGGWPGYHTHWTPLPPAPIPATAYRRRLDIMLRKGGERIRAKLAGKQVLIRSEEHIAWWREGYCGYTTSRAHAGVYLFEDAFEHTRHCGREKRIVFEVVA